MGQAQAQSTNDFATSTDVSSNEPSELYLACRNGDIEKVAQILTHLNTSNINRLEPNGSTSLHAASFFGHKTIVQMLLQNGAQSWIVNKYKMTPYEEAANDEIRSLFHRPLETNSNRFTDDDTNNGCLELISEKKIEENTNNNIPNSWIEGYKNIGKDFETKGIKFIVRAQMTKYYLTSLQRSNDCARELRRILKLSVPSNHPDYKIACRLFDEYCSRNQIEHLIRLYTLETGFYHALHSNVEIFTVEIYSQLQNLKDRFFQGKTYRGLSMTTKDIDDYKWGVHNQGTLIEIKTLTSTSIDSKVAYEFARGKKTNNTNCHRVICELHFDRSCSTAIDLRRHADKNLLCLSAYEDEAEVLVLPGTLFKVQDVSQEKDTGRYTIVLQNMHVPLNIILEAFKELQT
ncbi:unnamed protein product [Rotaria socialis]|uniref:NAD(+)--protein-arginine ADP-ribosyltransferase n=2 Tax=Rotaria TaxID=231623 RepID=A0A816NGM0_9BILA|nr:unnamed protein product [Rotaria magnacalcarata]CAF3373377.1 unnamed protein product [Rotaria socialis]CAF2067024.1 unnamed protein product [Rotaria magnacalcarata]CAF3378919.1 unnamed protein product [Rotaria socialis]CAF3454359.1 unnamed protein product [Rotaria socialis]